MNIPAPRVSIPESLEQKVVEIHECFLCGDTTNNIRFCSMCNHYFCDLCRVKYGERLQAAAKEKAEKLKNIFKKFW